MSKDCTIAKNNSPVLSTISPTFKVYEHREGGSVTVRLDAIACITEGKKLGDARHAPVGSSLHHSWGTPLSHPDGPAVMVLLFSF